MKFAKRYIETAEKIITAYDGAVPLHHFLRQFFSADKKYGSKDRKAITHACYCFYRTGHAFENASVQQKIILSIFLCSDDIVSWSPLYSEEELNNWSSKLEDRITYLNNHYTLKAEEVFPWQDEISDELDKQAFTFSHLAQPNLYLRIRPGKDRKVLQTLNAANISFQLCNDDCISLANSTNIEKLLSLNSDIVVQDFSSQAIAQTLSTIHSPLSTLKVWDCCAASGGKSILAYDVFKKIDLTVSDVRPSIIHNLEKRFAEAGIKSYRSFVADLTNSKFQISNSQFDLIICDAPCSGSGTWSRTPEQLYYFTEEKINYYSSLQQKIVSNVIPALAENGYFLYITCSVFKKENEDVVEFIKTNTSLQLVNAEYLMGYDKKADTMFAALFTASKH